LKVAPVSNNFGYKFVQSVLKDPEPVKLHRTAPFIWQFMNRNHHLFPQVRELTQSLVDTQPSAASAMASAALDAFARHRGHSYFKRDSDVPLFKAMRGNAAMKMGLIVIPVAKNHPAYPVYQSQGDWITGNDDSAWDLLDENWEAFMPVHRELSMPYLKWVLQRVIYSRDEGRQEELIKALIGWVGEEGSPLTPEEKVEIEIAYGDIAMQRGQLRQAHEIFSRTEKNEAYQELPIRYQATLRKADAERIAKNFDGALQTLNELELERVPEIWTEIRYSRALVYFDMEEFDDSKDDIDSILAREPNHADAKILLGKVQLKRQKLMEATEVELGSSSSQRSLVPGEKLKVTLTDPTLEVSGAGTEIEVVVWATSGDKESFFLRQFGDQKTKFRGEVVTALGAPEPGDDVLQVIGDDEVFYAYSERFREKMNDIDEKRGGPIIIASDAMLMASARKLLSEAEQRTADMAELMNAAGNDGGSQAKGAAMAEMAARAMDPEARAEQQGFSDAEFAKFITNVAKPGNPIYARVIDLDRSRTPDIDELTVSVSSSSGDSISRIVLKETDTHSGWFEGKIPTTGAQASAFARNTEPGRNPNMIISPSADTYPAWRPVASKDVTPEFKVDLNDNVELGELTITAAEEGAGLKTFALLTGMSDAGLTMVGAYPNHQGAVEKPWHPSVVIMNDTDHHHGRNERSVYDLSEISAHLDRGWMTQAYAAGVGENVAGPSEAMKESIPAKVKWLRQNRHHNAHVIYRFRGYFHEPQDVTRRFKLELGKFQIPEKLHSSVAHPPQFLLAVDGRPITSQDNPNRLEGEVNLRAGVHRFEIWATGWDSTIGFGRSVRLLSNLENPDALTECPDSFFDPESFPESSLDHRNSPATITASDDGKIFKVKFAPGSRTRQIKLLLLDHEGSVPALNKLELTAPDGERILPVAEDFAALNKNDTLEILTGDKIFVRYVDDRFVTESKQRLERSLNVAFTDARAEFADMEPRWDSRAGEEKPYYERLLRFPYDKPLALAIHDADMDVSVEPDRVKVQLSTKAGGVKEFEAVETDDSTGVFKLVVTPVAGAPSGASQIQVGLGGTITATYLDEENNRPGVPIERVATINHAAFVMPELVLAQPTVTPVESDANRTLIHGFDRRDYRDEDRPRLASETVTPRWNIDNQLIPTTKMPEGGFKVVHGRRLYMELIAPQVALGTSSNVTLYAQTDAGRKAAGVTDGSGFDITVPGTITMTGRLGVNGAPDWRLVPMLESYTGGHIPTFTNPEMDRFRTSVPIIAGVLSPYGALSYEEKAELREKAKESRSAAEFLERASRLQGLVVQPGERIHLGFQYKDEAG
ncbi:MAG: tetratricopeptide repeat protein, partial [Haloferula sp.]